MFLCKEMIENEVCVYDSGTAKVRMCVYVCVCFVYSLHQPVADPTISLEGDSDMASASLSRRPSSLASAEPTLCLGTPKLSGQLPHTSNRVTPRPSNGPKQNA